MLRWQLRAQRKHGRWQMVCGYVGSGKCGRWRKGHKQSDMVYRDGPAEEETEKRQGREGRDKTWVDDVQVILLCILFPPHTQTITFPLAAHKKWEPDPEYEVFLFKGEQTGWDATATELIKYFWISTFNCKTNQKRKTFHITTHMHNYFLMVMPQLHTHFHNKWTL